ncbi:MAG: TolC family protein [Planctomycetota bacterium]|jgi:outer membrane protein TolC
MNRRLLTSLCLVLAGLAVTGCDPNLAQTVEETDAAVYTIIDNAWDDSFGSRDNYIIDSNDPNPESATLAMVLVDRLTLSDAVALATVQNRDYATEKETLYLTALEQTDIRHLYEPMPFAGGEGGYYKDGPDEGAGAYAGAGFEQLLATGARISTDISLGWVDILSGDIRSGFSTIATAAITQPLLRGAGRKIALENLTQAEQNTLYQIRSFNRFRKEFVTAIMTDYYRLLQLNDERINARDYYFALAEMQKKLKKRTVAGKLPRYELEQAEQDQMNAMSDYVRAQKDYDDALDAFKLRLAIVPSRPIQLDMNELIALRESVGADIALSPQQAVEIALEQRLDLANVSDGILDAERKVDVAADAIRAELNLIGIANPQNPSGRASVPSRSLSNGTDLELTRDRYAAALQLDLPIDRLFEKNEYRRSLITLMQQQRAYQQASDTVVLEVQTSHRRMSEAHQRYQIEQKSTQLAEKRTASTLLLLQYGRANTRDTLDAREDYLDAKNAETEALVDYAIATLEFFRDTEIMKIKPDGLWEKSAPLALE